MPSEANGSDWDLCLSLGTSPVRPEIYKAEAPVAAETLSGRRRRRNLAPTASPTSLLLLLPLYLARYLLRWLRV